MLITYIIIATSVTIIGAIIEARRGVDFNSGSWVALAIVALLWLPLLALYAYLVTQYLVCRFVWWVFGKYK